LNFYKTGVLAVKKNGLAEKGQLKIFFLFAG